MSRPFRLLIAAMAVVVVAMTLKAASPSLADTIGRPPLADGDRHPVVEIKDARLKFEINSTDGDGGIQVFLDADPWKTMSIYDPNGKRVLTVTTSGRIGQQGGTELFMESAEPTFEELPIDQLLERFPAGEYEFRGRGLNGERFRGTAVLTHDLPDGPQLVSPLEDQGPQDPEHTVVRWEPVDPPNGSPIIGYQVLVVQPDTGITALPKIILDVMMPADATEMHVPPGYLQPDTEYEWEVLAIESGGNQTLSSDTFITSGGSPAPDFESLTPDDFVATVDNPYFPRLPGDTWVYEGQTDEGLRRTESQVLPDTVEILGIQTTVVTNKDFLDGQLTEDNLDYFAQDRDGNVWYLGEEVANYDDGELADHGGSWRAGDDGNIPGIVMLADPPSQLGQTYQQEHLVGCTKDRAEIVSVDEAVTVPAGTFDGVVQTHDTSAVELDLNEHKFYAAGVGLIKTVDLESGDEFVLIETSR